MPAMHGNGSASRRIVYSESSGYDSDTLVHPSCQSSLHPAREPDCIGWREVFESPEINRKPHPMQWTDNECKLWNNLDTVDESRSSRLVILQKLKPSCAV